MVAALRLGLVLSLAGLGACTGDPCAGGSMLDSEQGLVVTASEHPTGWGFEDCFQCHHEATLHRVGCTPSVDLAALRAQVDAEGLASCASCHGDNSVNTDTAVDTGEGGAR